ncbi:DNA topoisomerase 2 [Massospora cicadina]|nr:DNA topoisomerase 2 [Massospora cicadina]
MNEVEQAESDADSEAQMAPEAGEPTLAPILNANPHKLGKKKTIEEIYQKKDAAGTHPSEARYLYWLNQDDIPMAVTINPQQNLILVYNNVSGIPVEFYKKEKVYIPELIFGHLLTSSNYDDSEKKLCNIFSTEFIIETAIKAPGKKYYQKFTKNMSVIGPPKITELGRGEDFTRITFQPDLSKFQMNHLNADIVGLLKRSTPGLDGEDLTERLVFEWVSERWND